MATPYRPIAARPFSASLGKCFSRSQRAALGASCSCAKRRTACRISSCCISVGTNVGQGMVGEKPPLFAVASGDAVDAPPAHFQDLGGAIHVPALGGSEKRGAQLCGERVLLE